MSLEETGSTANEERRTSARIPVEMWVEEATDRELYFQRGANISEGGIFLEHTIPHPLGTEVTLRFVLPGDEEPIKVKGEIVNVNHERPGLGMGIKFLDISEDAHRRILAYILRATRRKSP